MRRKVESYEETEKKLAGVVKKVVEETNTKADGGYVSVDSKEALKKNWDKISNMTLPNKKQTYTDATYNLQLGLEPEHVTHPGELAKDLGIEEESLVNAEAKSLERFCANLEDKIKDAYESSITVMEAEKLAGEFLAAQMVIARELQKKSLDARMRKQGLKAIKAAVYLEGAKAGDKKPSDVLLNAQVDMSPIVTTEQAAFDTAEVEAEALQNYLKIFEAAHVFFRQQSRSNG